jgi:purine nucleoside phosphorylase
VFTCSGANARLTIYNCLSYYAEAQEQENTMNWLMRLAGVLVGAGLAQGAALAEELPHLQRNGDVTQLIVDGAPFLALAGELHNSSPSSPAYMAPIWDRLARNGVRTVIGAASWELVEPEEGRYDFTAVEDQIKQARSRKMRLVLIWFGAYKNAESTYAPSWVRRDETRFPRAQRDPNAKAKGIAAFLKGPILSVFSEKLVQADARAFAALMRHIKKVDRNQTVILMQVENEVGLLGDSRDRSPLANVAWDQQVPAALMNYLRDHRADLRPGLVELWERQGSRQSGTWAEVFGTTNAAEEIFMAWGFGRYVDTVAKAGLAEYSLPMYANAWLGPQPGSLEPGDYPSGGPVARMMDVWKAAAPSLALLAPDIYIDDFSGTLADFRRPDNPIFIPEARFDAGNLFVALGQYDAIAFSPFGIEDGAEDNEVFQAYRVLNEMTELTARAQREKRMRGFKIASGARQQETLGGYDLSISGPRSTMGAFGPGTGTAEKAQATGYGLVINSAENEFLVVGRAVSINFSATNAQVEIDSAHEGVFENGRWIPGRTLNGDERFFLFPNDSLRIVKVTLLRR